MDYNILPSMITVLIFIGTLMGGGLVKLLQPLIHKNFLYINVFCGGLLIGLLGLDLLPETFEKYDTLGVITGISIGILLIILIDASFHSNKNVSKPDSRVYIFLFLALFLHSIPTGIAIGFDLQDGVNSSLLNAVLIHHIPEGIILMASVMALDKKVLTFLGLAFVISLSVGVNILLGMNSAIESLKVHTIFTGTAIGTIGYVTIYEIIWKALRKLPKGKGALFICLGIFSIEGILLFASQVASSLSNIVQSFHKQYLERMDKGATYHGIQYYEFLPTVITYLVLFVFSLGVMYVFKKKFDQELKKLGERDHLKKKSPYLGSICIEILLVAGSVAINLH